MEKNLKISGMHCRSCEVLLKDVAEEIEGVQVTRVDHKMGRMEVECAPEKLEAVCRAIEKEGYRVKI